MIKTILIKPDLSVEEKVNEFAYQDFHEVHDKHLVKNNDIDLKLPDGSWFHTITTAEGMFITIHKRID
jgi:putative heme degradation protein